MLTLFARSILLYALVVFLLRAMGKRQIGQMQPYELVLTLMVADWAAEAMDSVGSPLLNAMLPVMALALAHGVITILSIKNQSFKAFIDGKPSVLVKNGRIDMTELRRQALPVPDLLERIRMAGYMDVTEVGCAILESSGVLTVFPLSQKRTPTNEECGIETDYETVPLTLVADGKIQRRNLPTGASGIDETWLHSQLQKAGLTAKDVLLATLNCRGILHIQRKNPRAPLIFRQALPKDSVRW